LWKKGLSVAEFKEGQSKTITGNTAWIILKAFAIFAIINVIFAVFYPLPALGSVSAYNLIFPGRMRLPYGDDPAKSYNLSLYNLDAMFASHEISGGEKDVDEYRVILVGDSATWGFLLQPEQTVSGYLNKQNIKMPDGKRLRAYNLGYPVMSLTKDLLFLQRALQYEPDLIIWPLTLESFPKDKQLFPPLLQKNPEAVRELADLTGLKYKIESLEFESPPLWERTIPGSRRSLADLVRLQIYGVMWAATGVDQDIPDTFNPRMEDLPDDSGFHSQRPPDLEEDELAFEVIQAGIELAGNTPVMIINEPVFISSGANSNIRYNFYYPRWAFDSYRKKMFELSESNNWIYKDYWDKINPSEFTNSAIHMTPKGTEEYASSITRAILSITQNE
jgi:hypothetical protein